MGGRSQALNWFVDRLQQLRHQAGNPSLNQLVELTSGLRRPLARSTISDKLNARSLPEWDFVVSFVIACKAYADKVGAPLARQELALAEWDALHLQLLHTVDDAEADDRLAASAAAELSRRASRTVPDVGASPTPATVPRQLPAAARNFAGRVVELATLDRLADEAAGAGASVVISAIDGTAGIGKTALAVHWAHRVADRFADGQLYVNLRGFDPGGAALTPGEALHGFLDALGVAPEKIPATVDAQAALYRSLLAGHRMLILLDNARDPEQVRPLLPGSPGCLSVVTSRTHLTSLVVGEGAHPLPLDLLPPEEARELLVRRIGGSRVAAEPAAVEEIIARCARLPLALSVVAARAASHPTFRLADLAAELRAARGGLAAFDNASDSTSDRAFDGASDRASDRGFDRAFDSAFDTGGGPETRVRAVFDWSYRRLSEPSARLFRLLAVHPGPDCGVATAASLAGQPAPDVRAHLSELARAHLVDERAPERFGFHDLLRDYAGELSRALDTEAARAAAQDRLLEHYLRVAHAADRALGPRRDAPLPLEPAPGVTADPPAVVAGAFLQFPEPAGSRADTASPPTDTASPPPDTAAALDWFTAEHAALLALIDLAAAARRDRQAWQLAWTLTQYLDRRGHYQDWADTHVTALRAAHRLADPGAQAYAHRMIARASGRLGRLDEGRAHMAEALRITGDLDDREGQANAHEGLSWLSELGGDHHSALHHAEQSLALLRESDEPDLLARELNSVGWCHAQLGDYARALDFCQQALAMNLAGGNISSTAETWDSIGYAQHHLGRPADAVHSYEQSLALWQDLGYRFYAAETLTRLGDVHRRAGSLDSARTAWEQALLIFDQMGHLDAAVVRDKLAALP